MSIKSPLELRPLALAALLALGFALPAQAQYTAKDWPEGPMKQRFTETCGGCHDINRVRVGYTPEGWLTVMRMMQNMEAPVPAAEWPAMAEYLMQSFPERPRPAAVIVPGPVKARIFLWDVPTQGSRQPARSARYERRFDLVDRPVVQQARPHRSENRRDPRIHLEVAAHRPAWAGRG